MKVSRRFFLLGASTLALSKAEAKFPRGAYGSANTNRVTLNAVTGYLNLVKGFGFVPDPLNADANGYPVTVPTSNMLANTSMPGGYFGEYVWKWTGQGSMQIVGSPPLIVSAGGTAIVELGTSSGVTVGGNTTVLSQTAPRITFAFGVNIQSITNSAVSNGAGGTKIRIGTSSGYAANLATGNILNVQGVTTQTNALGTWTITKIDAQTFDLDSSTWSAGQGVGGVQGRAIVQAANLSIYITTSGTFSGFSDLVWCRTADEASITSGLLVDNVLIDQYRYLLNPNGIAAPDAWLRFMDLIGVQSSFECDFSQRIPASYISYNATSNMRPGYLTTSPSGAITNSGGDAYTCANPTSSSGSYVDGEIVQGILSATNTGGNPTLNVGARGAKPIFGYTGLEHNIFRISAAPASAGLNMVFTFSATWLNGGTPYVFTYTTVSGDMASVGALNGSLVNAMNADAVLATAGGIRFGNSGQVAAWPRTAQAGRLTVTYTSGPAICTVIRIDPSSMPAAGRVTFVYNYLADGWIYREGGMTCSVPLEYILEACNRTGANCWWTWGLTKGAWVTAVAAYFRDNLNPGLKFGMEVANEVWNFGARPASLYNALGFALGWPDGSTTAVLSYTGLRTIQYAALSKAAWTTTRSAATHYVFQMGASFDTTAGSNFDTRQMKGSFLNASTYPIYGAYGGLNGSGSAPSYDTSPNRPVDITTATGCAPYWMSPWWSNSASEISGTALVNAPWLQASKDFTNGSTATAYAALVSMFDGTTVRSVGKIQYNFADWITNVFTPQEGLCSQYDYGRGALGLSPLGILNYECGPQWSFGANSVTGVNSVNATDIAALATQMTNLGWNVSAYTVSGTDDKTEAATQAFTMAQAWKYTSSYKNMIIQHVYQAQKTVSGSHREFKPAQYGYTVSMWGLFPASYGEGNQYSSYDAIHEFNL